MRLPALVLLSATLSAQDRPPQGAERERMWPAPTAEDWAKPCLITFQRTWEDAIAVSRETGKPILVCINMDGEIASEHYAGVRYRQPEIAALYEPYVCVIASVYRHNPRDHDDQGRRILCPRFGSVTCGEHIWIEPVIYEKFCDGQRVAPRHIAVDLDGNEVYDVYYRNDTASVFADIRDQVPEGRPTTVVRGDRPLLERVASRDIHDRVAVETAYREGDEELRKQLLDAAVKHGDAAQIDLLRLAIFGMNVEQARAARRALAEVKTPDAAELISDALQVPMPAEERDTLIATLKRLGEASVRAQWLAGVHEGLAGGSGTIKVEEWSRTATATTPAFGGDGLPSYIETQARAAYERPDDPLPRLELAEANLAFALAAPRVYAMNPRLGRLVARQLYGDARRAVGEAEALGATGWRPNSILALAAYYTGDTETAYARADAAMEHLPPGDTSWASMAVVTVFAESRWKSIKAAVRDGKNWPAEWLADLHSAYTVLLRHPLGTDGQVLWHYELLDWLGAGYRATRVLREGIERFRDSAPLHEKLRDRILKWRGPDALEAAYERMLAEKEDAAVMAPFAGLASVAAAESHRRTREYEKARAAYSRAIAHFERAVVADAGNGDSVRPAIALAHAGRARMAYELNDDEQALAGILASFETSPGSAGDRDGMGITPGETAQMLLARLREAKQEDLALKLETALGAIDPELLAPDRGLEAPR